MRNGKLTKREICETGSPHGIRQTTKLIISKLCKNKIIFSQHGERKQRGINTAKMKLLYGSKINGYNKALLIDIKRTSDTIDRAQLKIQIAQTSNTDTELTNILISILNGRIQTRPNEAPAQNSLGCLQVTHLEIKNFK